MGFIPILGISLAVVTIGALIYQAIIMSKYKGMHFNWFSFKKEGLNLGITKPEIKLLRDMAYNSRLSHFNSIYSSIKALDRCVIKSVHILHESELPEAEKHSKIEEIFLLRNKMDNIFLSRKQTLSSSEKLQSNQNIDLFFERIGTFKSKIIENSPEHLVVMIPIEALDNVEFTWKGKKVQCSFGKANDAEYTFASKVVEQNPGGNVGLLHIAHTNKMVRQQKRIFRRNPSNISVNIYTLSISSTGGSKKISVASPTPFNGVISNISGGGVAIRAGGTLAINTLIKLDFSLDFKETDIAIARVLAFSSIPNSADKILHTKFERISKKTRNRIFEYIYTNEQQNEENKYKPKTFVPSKDGSIVTNEETI